jgi:protoporphyrinogen oxidase/glycosyltransferase involved in cell wall biosynthesis
MPTCLIVFSHLRWSFVYQRPQHLLSRLARDYRVLFVEEPLRCAGAPHIERSSPAQGVEVLVPRTPVEAPGFHDDQLHVLQPLLNEYLRDHGIEDYLVWFYTPMALPLVASLRPRAVAYDCMDELASFKDAPRQLRQRETALLKIADVVFTGGPTLFDIKRKLHPNVHCLPSSVDAHHFAPGRLDFTSDEAREATRLQEPIAPPRLGFFGVIDERLDTRLLGALADARPDWQIVMAGPVAKIDPASLPRRANIHWLGMQPYARLPYLAAGWDVCLMPFAINEATRCISPTKTLEYMAAEKPIVSTPVHDVVTLYGEVVRIADDAASFVNACADALAESGHKRSRRMSDMLGTVSRVSWDHTAESVGKLLDAALRDAGDAPAAQRELGALALQASKGADAPALAAPAATRASRHVRHLIIGAGATGLSAALRLCDEHAGSQTLLVEREDRVGGGCRSLRLKGFTFDYAGHVMDRSDPWLVALYDRLLGENQHWQDLGWGPVGYPLEGGFQALADAFVPLLDCEIALNTGALHVSPSRRSVRLDDGRTVRFESLLSTMPLPQLVEACGDEVPREVRAAAGTLRRMSLRSVHVGVARERVSDMLWVDYPAAGTVFQRVFMQGNASPRCSPAGAFGLTCEVAYGHGNPLPRTGEALVERVLDDCRRLGLLHRRDSIVVTHTVDVPFAQVLPHAALEERVSVIRDWLASFGIVTAGRFGAWTTSAQSAFVAGREAADRVLGSREPAASAALA